MGEQAALTYTKKINPRAKKSGTVKMESVLAFTAVIGPVVEKQVTWLQSKGLLCRNKTCPACNQQMDLQHRSDITDKYRWRWPDSSCKKSLSLNTIERGLKRVCLACETRSNEDWNVFARGPKHVCFPPTPVTGVFSRRDRSAKDGRRRAATVPTSPTQSRRLSHLPNIFMMLSSVPFAAAVVTAPLRKLWPL